MRQQQPHNTGMVHAGFTYKPGSLKAECAVEGNREFDQVAAELGVPFRSTGKLVVGFTNHDRENILKFKAIGEKNGVEGMCTIDKEEIERIEPGRPAPKRFYDMTHEEWRAA